MPLQALEKIKPFYLKKSQFTFRGCQR